MNFYVINQLVIFYVFICYLFNFNFRVYYIFQFKEMYCSQARVADR
jgi:hypothetical protein